MLHGFFPAERPRGEKKETREKGRMKFVFHRSKHLYWLEHFDIGKYWNKNSTYKYRMEFDDNYLNVE